MTTRKEAIRRILGVTAVVAGSAIGSSIDLPLRDSDNGGFDSSNSGDNGSGGSSFIETPVSKTIFTPSILSRRSLLMTGPKIANAAAKEGRCDNGNSNNNSNDNLGDCVLTATLQARAFWVNPNSPEGKRVVTGLGGRIMRITHQDLAYIFRTAEQDCTDGTGFVIAEAVDMKNQRAMKEAIDAALNARPVGGKTKVEINASPESTGRFYNDALGKWEDGVALINLGFDRMSSESGKVLWTSPEGERARLCIAGETVNSLVYQVRSIDGVYTGHNGIEPNRPYVENHKIYSN